jgi:lipid II isoglutaminyl synthase (glutamine-hydrolysing)
MRPLKIVHLYPSEMNIYGDTGNRLVLEKRLQWRGIAYEIVLVAIGDPIPTDADIIIGGGGQDKSQTLVAEDLFTKKSALKALVDSGCVMLMICGMYQLFGKEFVTSAGESIPGLGLIDVTTVAKPGRIIGNVVVDMSGVGEVVGFENHSGRTYLGNGVSNLSKVIRGVGNNDDSGYEGCRYKNVFATYMHGPVLSKNPVLADMLIRLAQSRLGVSTELTILDDTLEQTAANIAAHRPR